MLSSDPGKNLYNNKVVIDSWNNIKKYADIKKSFFIFDEQRVVGSGVWVKSFLKIARAGNEWILLSATPGDKWEDYIPVFVANGFIIIKQNLAKEHLVFSRFSKFPKVEKYLGTKRLERLRSSILVDMDFQRKTIAHHEDIPVNYDIFKYRDAMRNRWNPYTNEPIQKPAGLCYVLRRITNEDVSRQLALLEIF